MGTNVPLETGVRGGSGSYSVPCSQLTLPHLGEPDSLTLGENESFSPFFFFLSIGPPEQIKYDTECQEIAQMIIKVLQENHFSTHNASDTKGVGSFLTATTGFPPLHTSWVPYCSVQSAAIHLSRSRAQSDASHRSRLSSVCLTNRL